MSQWQDRNWLGWKRKRYSQSGTEGDLDQLPLPRISCVPPSFASDLLGGVSFNAQIFQDYLHSITQKVRPSAID